MDPLVFLLIAGGVGAASILNAVARVQERTGTWMQAAQEAGLTEVALSKKLGFDSGLSGKAGPLEVRLETYRRGKTETGTRITISGLNHHYGQLSLRSETLVTRLGKSMGRTEIELGDPKFDDAVYLQGAPELTFAIFDAQTRRLVRRLVAGCLEGPGHPGTVNFDGTVALDDDELRVEMKDPHRGLPLILLKLIAIAQRLARPSDVIGRLVEHFNRDPVLGVRLANLRVLLERHPQHRRTRRALREALGDPSEEIRLRAALELGEPARAVLLEIASCRDSDDSRAAQAVAGLGDQLAEDRAVAILVQSLEAQRWATAAACVESVGRWSGGRAVTLLARALSAEDAAVAAAAARALGATGEAAAEAPLIEALAGDSPEVLAAVAGALQHVGTAAAVMLLRGASERVPDGALRRAAREAIATIQSRLQGATPGQLSLSSSETGQVTLAGDDARGRVSLPEEPGA
jgi:hypothetical protein